MARAGRKFEPREQGVMNRRAMMLVEKLLREQTMVFRVE